MQAEITHYGIFDMQVCVPEDWSDSEIVDYANEYNPSSLENGWIIRREGDEFLNGSPERNTCEERLGFVHVVLDC